MLHVRVVAGSGGGPDKTILRSAGYVDPTQLRIAAAYIHPHNDPGILGLRQRAGEWGCPFYEIGETGPLDPSTVRSLLNLCRKLRVAVWHGHDYKSNVLGLMLRRWWPMRLVTTVHGWTHDTARTRLYYHIDNLCLTRYDHVMAVSPMLVEHCRSLGVREEQLSYVPNGIALEDYVPGDRAVMRKALGLADGALAIGVVGRLSVEKGVDRAIATLAALREKPAYADTQLHLIGDGPQRGQLDGMVESLGLRGAVHFHGWQADTRRFYDALDLLLLPSHTEGLPNVVLEAMAMNVPVAATDVGGVRELLDEGRCGTILNQDATTWPLHLAPLLVSVARRHELARQARQRVMSHYAFEKRMAREVAVYQRVLSIQRPQTLRRAA
ncbi:MAG: glycosyltransferase [Phycisphaeraceae bacterium]